MICKICKSESRELFTTKVLYKYSVKYYQCSSCNFIQTEDPYWLEDAYSMAITPVDIGLVYRNLHLYPIVSAIISKFLHASGNFLDYGGGYGLFTRIMRDEGYCYFRQDIHCENLFATHFDYTDLPGDSRFEMLSAFEVFEHLVNPKQELSIMLGLSDCILFSTELVPIGDISRDSWWYLMPEMGQHVSLFSLESLQFLAKSNSLYFYTNGKNIHMFSKRKLNGNLFKLFTRFKIAKFYLTLLRKRRKSYLVNDFEFVLRSQKI